MPSRDPEPYAPIRQLVFRSHAMVPEVSTEVLDILRQAQRRNKASGITGHLHLQNSLFWQFIEGSHDAVADLLHRLQRDTRHSNVKVLLDRDATARHLDDWSMSLGRTSEFDLRKLLPYGVTDLTALHAEDIIRYFCGVVAPVLQRGGLN